jgi:hypothetical protein
MRLSIQGRPIACLATALFAFASPAAAADGPQEWRLIETPIVVVAPSKAPDPDVVRIAKLGDELLSAPVGAATAATFRDGVTLDVLGQRFEIKRENILPGSLVDHGASAALSKDARVFCTAAQPVQLPLDSSGKPIKSKRFRNMVSLCLVDSERDGLIDHGFVLGARQPADIAPVQIGPLSYQFGENVPFKDARMVLVYRKGAALQGLILAFDMQVDGRDIGAVSYMFGMKPDQIEAASERETRWKSYPNSFAFGPVGISVEGRDESDRSLRYRITSGFKTMLVRPGFAMRWIYY